MIGYRNVVMTVLAALATAAHADVRYSLVPLPETTDFPFEFAPSITVGAVNNGRQVVGEVERLPARVE